MASRLMSCWSTFAFGCRQEVLQLHVPGWEVVGGSQGAVHPDPVEVVGYSPGWPERFWDWSVRLARELGAVASRIDHVGSTAVPGLAAKPIVDVQVKRPRRGG